MKIFLIAVILALNSMMAKAQLPIATFDISETVRDSLAKAWDEKNPEQNERAYCVSYTISMEMDRRIHYNLDSLVVPDSTQYPTPMSIHFWCKKGTVTLHIHTPTTCEQDEFGGVRLNTCMMGGPLAWICGPSSGDFRFLEVRNQRIGFIQCDKHAIVPFFNYHWNPDAVKGADGWKNTTKKVIPPKITSPADSLTKANIIP